MTPQEFVFKWGGIITTAKEISIAQSHFNDVCALVGHPTPLDYDPEQKTFTFEKSAEATSRADVFFRHKFIWEYKRPNGDLFKAHQQLLRYSKVLEEPPLLVTSDTRQIILHTNHNNENFRGLIDEQYQITLDDILAGHGLELLKRLFFDPFSFKPKMSRAEVTQGTADAFVTITDSMRKLGHHPERLAHFFARIFFILFSEDIGLLPKQFVQQTAYYNREIPTDFGRLLGALFRAMRKGGEYGFRVVRHFNGNLFDDDDVPLLDQGVIDKLAAVAEQNWSQVDPTIFGQLFERVIDQGKRSQLGAHYTSEEDITLLIEPVLMQPLRDEWAKVEEETARLLRKGDRETAFRRLKTLAEKISAVRVLDPACGSGNFLFVAMQKLLGLQRDLIVFAERHQLPKIELSVHPRQLFGIEKNQYAHELAQVVIWIGYLQWRINNGFGDIPEPILPTLTQIDWRDAILDFDANGNPIEPTWPSADVIIGNPPFLGDKKMRRELGDEYVNFLRKLYTDRLPGQSDLVCYWFEKARNQIANGDAKRAGLIATQGIRGSANRTVLKRIKESGDIFWAYSDRAWILEGANVRISLIGFDNGTTKTKILNGKKVRFINADLQNHVDLTNMHPLTENQQLSFIGTQKTGGFDLTEEQASAMIAADPANRDVIKPWINALDIVRRPREMWVIDFGTDRTQEEAARYAEPFNYVENHVKSMRTEVRRKNHREKWWLFGETRPGMRSAISDLTRFIGTPLVSKHRIFVWLKPTIIPENLVVVIAREDNYFFGILHSRVHEIWSLRMGTSLEDRPRYTPTTTFATFPFPYPPNAEPDHATTPEIIEIAEVAMLLNQLREAWLYPDPTTLNGGVGSRYQDVVKNRTLTALYNALENYRTDYLSIPYAERESQWDKQYKRSIEFATMDDLHHLHNDLDRAVLGAYGWSADFSDDEILARLLALNTERA